MQICKPNTYIYFVGHIPKIHCFHSPHSSNYDDDEPRRDEIQWHGSANRWNDGTEAHTHILHALQYTMVTVTASERCVRCSMAT